MSEIKDGDYNLCENCNKIINKKYLHCSAECAQAFKIAADKEIKQMKTPIELIRERTEKDFENSLEYWRDLAKMQREHIDKLIRAHEVLRQGYVDECGPCINGMDCDCPLATADKIMCEESK